MDDAPKLDLDGYEDVDIEDEDNPEWTEADFAAAKPAREVLGDAFVDVWERARRERTPEAAMLENVTLPREVSDWYKAQGGPWRERVEEDLIDLVRIKKRG